MSLCQGMVQKRLLLHASRSNQIVSIRTSTRLQGYVWPMCDPLGTMRSSVSAGHLRKVHALTLTLGTRYEGCPVCIYTMLVLQGYSEKQSRN